MSIAMLEIECLLENVSSGFRYSGIQLDKEFYPEGYLERFRRIDKRKKTIVIQITSILTLIKRELNIDLRMIPDDFADFKQRRTTQVKENVEYLLAKLNALLD